MILCVFFLNIFYLVLRLPFGSVNIELAHCHQLPNFVKPFMRWSWGFPTGLDFRVSRLRWNTLWSITICNGDSEISGSIKGIQGTSGYIVAFKSAVLLVCCDVYSECVMIYQLQAGGPRGHGIVVLDKPPSAARGLVRCRVRIYKLTNWDMIRHHYPISNFGLILNFEVLYDFMIIGSALGL